MLIYEFTEKLNTFVTALKKILKKALTILLITALIAAISSKFFGYKILYIATGSMESYIKKGQLILVKAIDEHEELIPGQVYTYHPKDKNYTITHRLIYKTDNGMLVFKGDNNEYEDPEAVDKCNILYKLIAK